MFIVVEDMNLSGILDQLLQGVMSHSFNLIFFFFYITVIGLPLSLGC